MPFGLGIFMDFLHDVKNPARLTIECAQTCRNRCGGSAKLGENWGLFCAGRVKLGDTW